MPSTYSNIKIQLMATGENNTTWGNVTNINLGTALEEAIVGSADVTFASGNVTLTLTDTNASQTARHMRLRCTGVTGGSTRNLVVPSIEKPYIVQNDCLNSIVVKTAAGTGVTVPAGKTLWVYSDGVNVVDVTTHLSSLTLSTDLAVADGGTGASTFTANGIIYGNTTSALLATAAGTTGQVLVGNTGGAPSWATLSGIGVTTFSAGTTGFTPSSATSGAITLAGTLGVANGGTGTATQFTAGSVVFAGASGVYSQDNANLFWDNANDRLGIGTATPTGKLDVIGSAYIGSNSNNSFFIDSDASLVTVGAAGRTAFSTSALRFLTSDGSAALERMRITSAGNVGVGTAFPSTVYRQTINGDGSSILGGLSLRNNGTETLVIGNITATNDVDSEIWNPRNGFLRFATNNAERMRITAAGVVGVGTTGPASYATRFAVVGGNLGVSEDGNTVTTIRANANVSNIGAFNATGAALTFSTAPSGSGEIERMRITSTGDVGIGTTVPGYTLDVRTNASNGIRVGSNSNAFGALLSWDNPTGEARLSSIGAYVLTFGTNTTERMRITTAGNVGIGTTNPLGKLHIDGNFIRIDQSGANLAFFGNAADLITGAPVGAGIRFDNTALRISASSSEIAQFTIGGSFLVGLTSPVLGERLGVSGSIITQGTGGGEVGLFGTFGGSTQVIGAYSNVPVEFRTNNVERMRITIGGNVGIGTSTPGAPLEVSSTTDEILRITSTGNPYASWYAAGTRRGYIQAQAAAFTVASDTAIPLIFSTNTIERMRIDSAGLVGIGTAGQPIRGNLDISLGGLTTAGLERSIHFGYSSADFYGFKLSNINNPGSTAAGTFSIQRGTTAAWVDALLINDVGNVGIGTASPTAYSGYTNLEIDGASNGGILSIKKAGSVVGYLNGASGLLLLAQSNDLKLTTTGATSMQFNTNATERMRIDSSGNVGIGTSSPGNRLHVYETTSQTVARFESTLGSAFISLHTGSAQTFLGSDSAGAFLVQTPGSGYSTKMFVGATGNVGIGTTSPTQLLEVSFEDATANRTNPVNVAAITATHSVGSGQVYDGFGPALVFRSESYDGLIYSGPRVRMAINDDSILPNSGSSLVFDITATKGASPTEAMRIEPNGDVGIGTTTPSYPLEVRRDGASSFNYIGSLNTTATGAFGAGFLARAGSGFAYFYMRGDGLAYVENATANPLGFATNGSEKMRITSAGNVGIGTSAPALPLVVSNAGTTGIEFSPSGGVGGGTYIQSYNRNTATYTPNTNYAASQTWYVGATRAMDLDSSGSLLVGTTSSDGYRFKTEGSYPFLSKGTGGAALTAASIWNNDTAGDNIFIVFSTETGGTTRGSIDYNRAGGLTRYNTTSDYRAKDIIGPTQNSGAAIDALKVYDGKMKGATIERPMLIAHEAQEVVPYAVTGEKDAVNDDGTPKFQQIDVSSLVPLLIAEIQSLRARVAQLEGK